MNIHKINSTSQEHQNFIAQNRIDPITGDAILEGNEVVFCTGCKSVFLRDSWKYLGEKHCGQSETLKKFPPKTDKIEVNLEEKILFYIKLATNAKTSGTRLPKNLDLTIWKEKKRELYKYDKIVHRVRPYLVVFCFLLGGYFSYLVGNISPLLPIFLLVLFFIVIGGMFSYTKTKNIKTIHGKFQNNVFFISKGGIGLSSAYGRKEYFLSAKHIFSLKFEFSHKKYIEGSYCVIKSKYGEETRLMITHYSKESKVCSFLEALHELNSKYDIPTHIEVSNDNSIYTELQENIGQKNYAITVSKI